MLDIGGGFPARYAEPIPDLADYGACIRQAVQRHLPYRIQLHRRRLHHLLRLHLQQRRRPTTYCVR
jgi:diaminopimelate decarboxylase